MVFMNDLSKYCIHYQESIRNAFKNIGLNKKNFVVVVDNNDKVIGIITDGDFRRAIWNSALLEYNVETIMNNDRT